MAKSASDEHGVREPSVLLDGGVEKMDFFRTRRIGRYLNCQQFGL